VTEPPASTSAPTQPLRTVVVEDLESVSIHVPAWDALAVELGRPFCAPAWMLSWWRQTRSERTRLRIVLVLDGAELVGVGPFFAQLGRLGLVEMRLLTAGFCHRISPLACPGRETAVAASLAGALAAMRPSPDSVVFEGLDAEDPWPALIAAAWPAPRAPHLRTDLRMDAPEVELGGSYEEWFERRERSVRKEARRTARRLEEENVNGRMCEDEDAIETLMRLHHSRWEGRGGSHVGADARRVIAEAADELAGSGRITVALLEAPDAPVAAELVVRAGAVAAFWGGGFDPRWARSAPGTQAILLALRALASQGVDVADLGGGEHPYKRRLADGNRPLVWRTLFPRGVRYPLIRARLAPKHTSIALRGALRRHPAGLRMAHALRHLHQ
jgi:CelD/BcsL family acetyltransferase involved in cellulose biosynthesis